MFTTILLVDYIRVLRLLKILFIDSNTAPSAVSSRGVLVSDFYSSMTTDTADASAGVFINLRKPVHLLYLQDRVRQRGYHS